MGTHLIPGADANTRSIIESIRRVVRGLRMYSRAAEKSVGLSGAQLFVLQKLAAGRAMSLNELAERTLTHQSSVSVVVQRLVDKGFVKRLPSRKDKRRVELSLTNEGNALLEKSPGAAQDRLIYALRRMPDTRRRLLSSLLEQLVQDTGLADETPSLFFEDDSPVIAIEVNRKNKKVKK